MKAFFRRLFAALANFAVFFITLAVACVLIHHNLPVPDVSTVQSKLEQMKAHGDDYDTLFIGTSRIYHHIIPQLFDQLTAEKGIPTKSFNAGVDGMRAPEDGYLLDEILKFHPKHLRWVFVESDSIRVPVDPRKRGTNRVVYWHDWPRLKLLFFESFNIKWPHHPAGVVRAVWAPLGDFYEHAQLFVVNMSNIGRGAFVSTRLAHPSWPPVYWEPNGKSGDGFLEVKDRQHLSRDDRTKYEQMLAVRQEHPARVDFGSDVSQEALWAMIRKIEAIGATPVLIVPPTTAGKNFYPALRNGVAPPVFDFADLQRYPELYDEQYRLDTDHLNTPGAKVFTQCLVERFAELAKPPQKN